MKRRNFKNWGGGDTPEISNKTSWRDTFCTSRVFFPHWKLIYGPSQTIMTIISYCIIYVIIYIYIYYSRIANHGHQSIDLCATKAGTSTNITTGTPVPRPTSSLVLFSSSPGQCPNPVAVTNGNLATQKSGRCGPSKNHHHLSHRIHVWYIC